MPRYTYALTQDEARELFAEKDDFESVEECLEWRSMQDEPESYPVYQSSARAGAPVAPDRLEGWDDYAERWLDITEFCGFRKPVAGSMQAAIDFTEVA